MLKYVTTTPDTNAFGGSVRTGISSTNDGGMNYEGAAAINAPIADRAAIRSSGFYSQDGGYIDDPLRGRDDVNESQIYGGRVDVLLQPVDDLSIRLTAFAQDISRDSSIAADFDRLSGREIGGELEQRRMLAEPFEQEFRLVSATVSYDFGPAALTSISSYQTVRSKGFTDASPLYAPAFGAFGVASIGLQKENETDKLTQEVRLAATGAHLDWLVGGFYTKEDSEQFQTLPSFDATGTPLPINFLTVTVPSRYEEYAGFATLTYHATDRLDIAGGLRYAHNSQEQEQIGSGLLIQSIPQRDSSDSVVTYLANVRYRVNDHLMPYLRVATGYRPGGPNLVANDLSGRPLAPPTFDSDELRSYEGGIKASTSDSRLSIDLALYAIDWDDLQIVAARNGIGVVANASAARSRGAELTITALPPPQLTLVGAFGYIDAELSEDAPDLGGAAGDSLPDTPDFTATISADYRFTLAGRDAFAGTTLRHVADRVSGYDDNSSLPQYELPDYTAVDVRTGIQLGGTRVQLYVKNLFDELGQLSATTVFSVVPGGPTEVSILQPRTIGINSTSTSEIHTYEHDEGPEYRWTVQVAAAHRGLRGAAVSDRGAARGGGLAFASAEPD